MPLVPFSSFPPPRRSERSLCPAAAAAGRAGGASAGSVRGAGKQSRETFCARGTLRNRSVLTAPGMVLLGRGAAFDLSLRSPLFCEPRSAAAGSSEPKGPLGGRKPCPALCYGWERWERESGQRKAETELLCVPLVFGVTNFTYCPAFAIVFHLQARRCHL